MGFLLDPNFAYILLILTIFLATLAVLVPGTGLLEAATLVVGALAGYAAFNLPVNPWALIVLGVGLIALISLLFLRRGQWLGLLISAAGFIGSSLFLFRSPEGGLAVHPALAVSASLLLGLYFWFGVRAGIRAWREKPPVHSLDRLVGQVGEARTAIHHEGSVYVGGEMWSARSPRPIPAGSKVRVVGREGLILLVEPLTAPSDKAEAPSPSA